MINKLNGFIPKDGTVNIAGLTDDFYDYATQWSAVAVYLGQVMRQNPVVTSANDGKHSAGSVHKKGLAVDIRIRDIDETLWDIVAKTVALLLGSPWVVVLEPKKIHLHIQLGTENIKAPNTLEHIGGGRWIRALG